MATRISTPQGVPRELRKGHELTDVHAGWIFGVVLFLAIAMILIHLLMSRMLDGLKKRPAPSDQWRSATAVPGGPTAAAFPRLQISPPRDLEAFRAREEAELNSYGWINRTAGLTRIPITQAMNLVLERGLPVRRGTNEAKTGPSTYELMQQRPLQRSTEGGKP